MRLIVPWHPQCQVYGIGLLRQALEHGHSVCQG